MNKKMGLMMAMGLLISAPLLSKDYLISTPRTSLLITANEGEKSKMQYYGVSITPVQIQNIYDAGLAFEADSYPAWAEARTDWTFGNALSIYGDLPVCPWRVSVSLLFGGGQGGCTDTVPAF